MTLGQRFARVVTQAVVRAPFLWRVFRGPMTRQFDRLAPEWDSTRVSRERLAPMLAALDAVPDVQRVLDVGTGSGAVARLLTERWPDAQVTGVDVSPGMVEEARRLGSGEHYDVGDASALPYPDASFDLLTLNNMIPFFDELARVTAPGGHVAIAYSRGSGTPIWVPVERVRAELERRGFLHVADFRVGPGVALLARRS
jgi:SAM-dependent methyltransferase